tara:strand:+ start:277 stop:996 length:720 start_codon:yes stop_codon:yes gene_type:complete
MITTLNNSITNQIEELKLLGWTEAGARVYSEKLLHKEISKESISEQAILIIILILSIILFISIVLFIKRKKLDGKSKSILNQSNLLKKLPLKEKAEDIETETIENTIIKAKIPFKDAFIKEFKSTAVNHGKFIEYFIVIIIISYDLMIKFIYEFSKEDQKIIANKLGNNFKINSEKVSKINQLNKISREERKKKLMRKTNSELKSLLIGVPYISKMNKEKLVENILLLEIKNKKLLTIN